MLMMKKQNIWFRMNKKRKVKYQIAKREISKIWMISSIWVHGCRVMEKM